jgi:signal peptidase I
MEENNVKQANAEETPKRTSLQALYDWIEIVAVSLAAVLVFLTFFARVTTVVGDSMLPTLHNGESLFVMCFGYEPQKGDIVVVQNDRSTVDYPIVKRIIATGGDTLEFDFANWLVYVNGELTDSKATSAVNKSTIEIWLTDSRYAPYANQLSLGNDIGPSGFPTTDCTIVDVKIYAQALNPEQVKTAYNAAAALFN